MKRASLFLSLFFFFAVLSLVKIRAESTQPFETSTEIYTNSIPDHFDYYVDVLECGFPIGKVTKKDSTLTYANSLAEVMSLLEKRNLELSDAYQKRQKKMLELLHGFEGTENVVSVTGAGVTSASEIKPALPLNPENLLLFFDCAKKALPLLKTRLQLIQTGNSLELPYVEMQLRSEQGPGGFSCGKYLTVLDVPPSSLLEEIKALSGLLSRQGEERKTLLKSFYLYGKSLKRIPLQSALFWEYFWKRLSFTAVFSKKELPKIEQFIQTYLSEQDKTFKRTSGPITISVSPESIKENILKDWQMAQTDFQGVL